MIALGLFDMESSLSMSNEGVGLIGINWDHWNQWIKITFNFLFLLFLVIFCFYGNDASHSLSRYTYWCNNNIISCQWDWNIMILLSNTFGSN